MPSLILPSRFNQQPQQTPPIDWSNPLAQGLQFAFVAGLGDVTRKRAQLTQYQTSQTRHGRSTLALSVGPFPAFGSLDVKIAGSFSVIVLGDFAAPASFTAPLVSQTTDAGGWKFGVASTGVVGYTHYGVADYVGTTVVAGTSGVIGMTATIGGALRVYSNGGFRESIAIGSMNTSLGASFTIGNRPNANDAASASKLSLAMYFDRLLTDAEHRAIAANPWQLFEAPLRQLWVGAGGATDTPVEPGAAAVLLTGFAPTVTRTASQGATPAPAALLLTGYAPTVSRTASLTATPSPGQIVLTGFAPTLTQTGQPAAPPPLAGGGGGPVREVRDYARRFDEADKPAKRSRSEKRKRRQLDTEALALLPDAAASLAPLIAQAAFVREAPALAWKLPQPMAPLAPRQAVEVWQQQIEPQKLIDDEHDLELLLLG